MLKPFAIRILVCSAALAALLPSAAAALITVGALDTPSQAIDVELRGDRAYVLDHYYGLRIIDVSNPAFPVEIGSHDTPGRAGDFGARL